MTFDLSVISKQRLLTVHLDMQKIVNSVAAAAPFEIVVMRALCTAQEEMQLWLECHNNDGSRNGQPWKTNCNGYAPGTIAPNGIPGRGISNHQTGHAVDLGVEINGDMQWGEEYVRAVSGMMLGQAAKIPSSTLSLLHTPVIWGGTFKTPDPDHFELNRCFYR